MIKILRQRAGLTQAEISKKLGYTSPQFISNIERGLADLPQDKFTATAKALGVSVSELVKLRLKSDKHKMLKRFGGMK